MICVQNIGSPKMEQVRPLCLYKLSFHMAKMLGTQVHAVTNSVLFANGSMLVLCILWIGGFISFSCPCKRYAVTLTGMPRHNCLPGQHLGVSARGAAMWQNARFSDTHKFDIHIISGKNSHRQTAITDHHQVIQAKHSHDHAVQLQIHELFPFWPMILIQIIMVIDGKYVNTHVWSHHIWNVFIPSCIELMAQSFSLTSWHGLHQFSFACMQFNMSVLLVLMKRSKNDKDFNDNWNVVIISGYIPRTSSHRQRYNAHLHSRFAV